MLKDAILKDTMTINPKWELGRVPRRGVFFCVVIQTNFQQLRNGRFSPNLATKLSRCPVDESGKTFSKIFTLRKNCPKNLKSKAVKQAPYSEQVTGHEMHCREIMFTPRCSPMVREFPSFGQLFSTTYGCGATGPNFPILAYFPHIKPLKRTFADQPGVTSQNDYRVVVQVQRGAFRHRSFPATSGSGAGDPQTCPNFRLWQMAIPIQNATTRRIRSEPKMSENAQF